MKALQDLFFAYKEKDSRTAGQIVGNEALPYKILSRLFQENRVEALGKALEISNLESAFEAAHRMKNISTNFESRLLYNVNYILQKQDRNRAVYQTIQVEFQPVNKLWEQLGQ